MGRLVQAHLDMDGRRDASCRRILIWMAAGTPRASASLYGWPHSFKILAELSNTRRSPTAFLPAALQPLSFADLPLSVAFARAFATSWYHARKLRPRRLFFACCVSARPLRLRVEKDTSRRNCRGSHLLDGFFTRSAFLFQQDWSPAVSKHPLGILTTSRSLSPHRILTCALG